MQHLNFILPIAIINHIMQCPVVIRENWMQHFKPIYQVYLHKNIILTILFNMLIIECLTDNQNKPISR